MIVHVNCEDNLCYADRFAKLDLPGLELHHLQLYLTYCYKIVFGLVKLNPADFSQFPSVINTRRHVYKLYKPRCSNVRVHFFSCRVINVWNSLPDSVSFESLQAFKRTVINVDYYYVGLRAAVSVSVRSLAVRLTGFICGHQVYL